MADSFSVLDAAEAPWKYSRQTDAPHRESVPSGLLALVFFVFAAYALLEQNVVVFVAAFLGFLFAFQSMRL